MNLDRCERGTLVFFLLETNLDVLQSVTKNKKFYITKWPSLEGKHRPRIDVGTKLVVIVMHLIS